MMTNPTDPTSKLDFEASQKARLENVKTLMVEVLEKGIASILPTAIEAASSDGKCGCRDVCGCDGVCNCA